MLLAAVGPLAVMQMVAWTGMLWNYSREATLVEAVESTFNGENPCSLCLSIQEIQKEQQTEEVVTWNSQLGLLLPIQWQEIRFDAPASSYALWLDIATERGSDPSEVVLPPPRQRAA